MTEGKRIGRRIKELRKQSGLTQEQVANELQMSPYYLRQIEHGKANPSVNLVGRIISYLETVIADRAKEEAVK